MKTEVTRTAFIYLDTYDVEEKISFDNQPDLLNKLYLLIDEKYPNEDSVLVEVKNRLPVWIDVDRLFNWVKYGKMSSVDDEWYNEIHSRIIVEPTTTK